MVFSSVYYVRIQITEQSAKRQTGKEILLKCVATVT